MPAMPHSQPATLSTGWPSMTKMSDWRMTEPTVAPKRYSSPAYAATGMTAASAAADRPGNVLSAPRAAAISRQAMKTAPATTTASSPSPTHMARVMSGMPTAAVASLVASKARMALLGRRMDSVRRCLRLLQSTETALALGVRLQGALDLALVKVGPIHRRRVELGVGCLPEEEVREAHFAGRPDHEVRLGQAMNVQVALKELFIESVG